MPLKKKVFLLLFLQKKKTFPALLCVASLIPPAQAQAPAYTKSGELTFPTEYRNWIYLTTGIDMSYSDRAPMQSASMFDNVFVNPTAWQAFRQTGHWPDKTMFVLENRGAASHGSINKHGKFQTTEVMGLEVHVREDARFTGGWGFFSFDSDKPAAQIAYSANCYSCHLAHGAVQTSFTQFYPTAKPIAQRAHNYQEK